MSGKHFPRELTRGLHLLTLLAGLSLLGWGCGGRPAGSSPSSTTGQIDDQVLLEEPISYEGSVSGKLVDSQTTRASTVEPGAAQELPPEFDSDNTVVRFTDLAGNVLLDQNGNPIAEAPINADGSFSADNLPVGTDFTICGDIGDNGSCDIEGNIVIPSTDGGEQGFLDGVVADPLTTTVLARLRAAARERGVDLNDLPISPVMVATRIVDAYTHLFEEAGIDQAITLDDIDNIPEEQLAELFEQLVPATARRGMEMAEGNLGLALAEDVEEIVLSVAEVFLRAGFPIADPPPPPDLSALANLGGVTTTTFAEIYRPPPGGPEGGPPEGGFPEDGPPESDFPGDFPMEPAQMEEPMGWDPAEEIVYLSTVSEPDRNFITGSDEDEEEGKPPLPAINDYLLMEMSRLQHEGRKITIGDLYELITDLEQGLGARLTFHIFDPHFFGPPMTVFETADGRGKAVNLEEFFFRMANEGFHEMDHEMFERRQAELRALLQELLADTIPPSFERLFGAFAGEQLVSIEGLSQRIREAEAHLPFSRSGPSAFFVIADGDPFRSDEDVSAVTVDTEVSMDGLVTSVTYNGSGSGTYYLGFTESTDSNGIVELLVRETGRFLHGQRGPVRLDMHDASIFQDVNGGPFIDSVSEHGVFYPGTHVTVMRDEYMPEPGPMEPMIAQEGEPPPPGPNEQLYVLATDIGPDAEPVRIDYDHATGQAVYNPAGRSLLMFVPDSHETGLFALFNEDTGRPATLDDPDGFFQAPPEMPDGFEGFFNEFDDPEHFDDFADTDDFFDAFDQFQEDGQLPPPEGGFPPPPDGEMPPPPDGEMPPPPDGEPPPPPDGEPPPPDDGTEPPPDDQPAPEEPPVPEEPAPPEEPPPDPAQVPDEETGEEPIPEEEPPVGDEPPLDEEVPPVDEPPSDEAFPPPPDEPPPPEGEYPPLEEYPPMNQPPPPPDGGFHEPEFILIASDQVIGLDVLRDEFTHVFGTEVPNERYDPSGDPYFDDINANGVHDPDEPTSQFRPTLFDPNDWRSTDIRLYYRRADNNGSISFEEVDWESPTPQTFDGVELVPRTYVPRLNAYCFGRPNTAINLLTAFFPPDFFDGTHSLDRDTQVDIFSAVAIINLVMDQMFNVEADVDIDGFGPMPSQRILIDAHMFVAPLNDPFVMLMEGFRDRSVASPSP